MKVCNVVPQVTNGTGLVDSELFTAISNSLPTFKGVALRNETKSIYEAYKSTAFSSKFGDWQLLKAVLNKSLNTRQKIEFASVYNSDIKLLTNSIKTKLDANGEPTMMSSEPVQKTTTKDATLLDGKTVHTFESNEDVELLASSLGTTSEILINNLIQNSNIYIYQDNRFIVKELKTTSKQIHEDNTIGKDLNILIDTNEGSKFTESSIGVLPIIKTVRNVDDLSEQFNTEEIMFTGKLVGSLLLSDIESLESMFKEQIKNKVPNYEQNLQIKSYVISALEKFRDTIKTKYNEVIEDKDNWSMSETLGKQYSTKAKHLQKVVATLDKSYADLINAIKYENPNTQEFSFMYDSILSIMKKHYNITVQYDTSENVIIQENSDNGIEYSVEVNMANWDDRKALNINNQFNVAKDIKILIAKAITKDYIDNIGQNISTESKYGVAQPLSVTDVWNTFISIAANSSNREQTIRNLKDINTHEYNGLLTTFIETIATNDAIWNSYYASAVQAVWNINQISIGTSNNNLTILVGNREINYMAFSKNIAVTQLRNSININLEAKKEYIETFAQDKVTSHKDAKSINDLLISNRKDLVEDINNLAIKIKTLGKPIDIYNWLELRFKQLGISHIINMQDVNRYIMLNQNNNLYGLDEAGNLENPFVNNFTKNNTSFESKLQQLKSTSTNLNTDVEELNNIKSMYLRTMNELVSNLLYISQNLATIKLNKVDSTSFDKLFNQGNSLKTLGKIIQNKYYRNTSLGYYNENGDIEQTPQKPSFLSDFTKLFLSYNTISDDNNIKLYFKDYLNDPTMKYNDFLFHPITGLFKVDNRNNIILETNDKNEIVRSNVSVNENFISNFKSSMLSGAQYKDTNTGAKYEDITGDTWKMFKIQSALTGVYGIPSSDSGRHYTISFDKYGLSNVNFDELGNHSSLLGMIKELGIEDSVDYTDKSIGKSKRIIDINDANTKVPIVAGNNIKLVTIKDLKTFGAEEQGLINSLNVRIDFLGRALTAYITDLKTQIDNGEKTEFNHTEMYNFLKNYTGSNVVIDFIKQFGGAATKQQFELADKGDKSRVNDITFKKQRVLELHQLLNPANNKYKTFDDYLGGKYLKLSDEDKANYLLSDKDLKESLFNNHISILDNTDTIKYYNNFVNQKIEFSTNPDMIINSDNELLKRYHTYRTSLLSNALRNTVNTELDVMRRAVSEMFDIETSFAQDLNNPEQSIAYASKITVKPSVQQMMNDGEMSAPMLSSGQRDTLTPNQKRKHKDYDANNQNKVLLGDVKILDIKGNPTGKAFKFNRMTYTETSSKGSKKLMTLENYIMNNIHNGQGTIKDVLYLVARTDKNTHPRRQGQPNEMNAQELQQDVQFANALFNKLYYSFVENWISNKQSKMVDSTKNFIDEMQVMTVAEMPSYIKGTNTKYNIDRQNVNLFSMNDDNSTLVNKNLLVKLKNNKLEARESEEIQRQITKSTNKSLLEAYLNDYLVHINIGEDILFGRSFEYKGIKDINKRVNEVIKNGTSNNSNHKIRSMTVLDIETHTNMFDLLSKNNGTDENTLWEQYKDTVEVGNGLSIITVDEYIARLKAINMYDKYKPYIDALTDTNVSYDPKAYKYISEQLKYYMYNRQGNSKGLLKGVMRSYQEKNSTIVLFPKMFKTTTYESINNWMNLRKIGELNFLSASKVGGQPTFKMHDVYTSEFNGNTINDTFEVPTVVRDGVSYFDDRIDKSIDNFSPENTVDIERYIVEHPLSSLRIQQDTVGHILDEEGTISTQMIKKMWNNMDDMENYIISDVTYDKDNNPTNHNTTYKGRTGNYEDGKRGMFENFHSAMSINAEQEMLDLIQHWGGLDEDGNIKYDVDGNIDISVKLIEKDIISYFNSSADIATSRALQATGENKFSFNNPSIRVKIEELLQSRITKNVALKIKQIHAPIMPDIFMQENSFSYSKDKVIRSNNLENMQKNGMISLSKEFYTSQEGKNNLELLSDYTDNNGVYHPAQIITNIWDSKFNEYRYFVDANGNRVSENGKPAPKDIVGTMPRIDIDLIPKEARTVVGTRIPHEGMQSSFVAEVVGFMNTESSQIIVPKHLSKRTGWDYDIDTVYIYPKELHKVNGKLKPISYEYDLQNSNTAYDTLDRKLTNQLKALKNKEYTNITNVKNIEIRKAIKEYKNAVADINDATIDRVYDVYDAIDNIKSKPLSKEEKLEKVIESAKSLLDVANFTPDSATLRSVTHAVTIEDIENILSSIIQDNTDSFKTLSNLITNVSNDILSNNATNTEALAALEQIDALNVTTPKRKFILKEVENDIKQKKQELNDKKNATIAASKLKFENAILAMKQDPAFVAKFKAMDTLKQASRESRDNMIIDTMMARIMSINSTVTKEQPNEYSIFKQVSTGINSKYGIDDSTSNFADIVDRASIENMNRDVAVLKATSVSLDNNYAILGSLRANTTGDRAIPFVVERGEFNAKSDAELVNILDSKIGNDNYYIEHLPYEEQNDITSIKKVTIFSMNFANNSQGDWTNINGSRITKFSSQITANILDAVKDALGINVNTHTIGILSMLANSPISHSTNMYGKEVQDNGFVYSNLILHQAVITKLLSQMNKSSRSGEFANKNNAIKIVKNDIFVGILSGLNNITIADNVSLLDIASRIMAEELVVNTSDDNNAIAEKISDWSNILKNGETITMKDNSKISSIQVYNFIVNALSSNSDVSLQDKITSLLSAEEFTQFEKNNLSEVLNNLSISKTINDIYYYNKDGKNNAEKYKIASPKSLKTITELKELYDNSIDNNYYDIDSAIVKQTSETNTSKQLEFINYLDNQLAILALFEHLDATANVISKSSAILSTDKKGTSPNSEVTSKLMNDIADMHIDVNAFIENMREVGYTDGEINEFKTKYYKARTINDVYSNGVLLASGKESIINTEIELFKGSDRSNVDSNGINRRYNNKLTTHLIPLEVNGTTLVKAVFPSFLTDNLNADKYDFKHSKYPYFEAQLAYANHFSTKVFANVLFSENPHVKALIDVIMVRLNLSSNVSNTARAKIRNKVINAIINQHIIETVPFFNGGLNNENSIIRNDNGATLKDEIRRVMGVGIIEEVVSTLNGEPITREVMKNDFIPSYKLLDGIASFKKLSAANKIHILKEELAYIAKDSKMDIKTASDIKLLLSYIEPKVTQADIEQNGFHVIRVRNSEEDSLSMKQRFTKMYYNNNPYVRETARDLIRYTFHKDGLSYGANISKWIDNSLLHEDSSQLYNKDNVLKEELAHPINDLTKLNKQLNNIGLKFNNSDIAVDTDLLVDMIRAQLYDDNKITPKISWDGRIESPSFNKLVPLDGKDTHIIEEDKKKIDNSKYSHNETVRVTIMNDNVGGIYAMKKYTPEGSHNVYYYPFAKHLTGVFTENVIPLYTGKLSSEERYLEIINNYDAGRTVQSDTRQVNDLFEYNQPLSDDARITGNKDNYQFLNHTTISNKSYTETAKQLLDNANAVIYIGNNSTYRNAFKSDKTIYTTLDNLKIDIIDNLDFTEGVKLVIVGDSISDNNISQKEYDSKIVPILRYLQAYRNITSVKTIFKHGVGESVYKATFNNNIESEYIKVGIKDDIRQVSALDDEDVRSLIFNTVTDKQNTVNHLINSFTIDLRLKDFVRNYENSMADTFDTNLEFIQKQLVDMKSEDSDFIGIINALESQFEIVDKILEFISTDGVTVGKDRFTFKELDVYKYLSGRNTDYKTNIAAKLVLYKNIISVADEIMKFKSMTYPIVTEEALSKLTKEQKEAVQKLYQNVYEYNTKLTQLKEERSLIRYSSKPLISDTFTTKDNKNVISRQGQVQHYSKLIDSKIKEYHGATIELTTRNPKFRNSAFQKIVKEIIGDNFNPLMPASITSPSAEQLINIYNQAMMYNDDLTFLQLNIESVTKTGSAIIDTTFKRFAELKINSNNKFVAARNRLSKILDDYGMSHKDFEFSTTRMEDIRNKFINPKTGTLISKYEYAKFYADEKLHKYASYKLRNILKTFDGTDNKSKDITILHNIDKGNKLSNPVNTKMVISQIIKHFQMKRIIDSEFIKTLYNNGTVTNNPNVEYVKYIKGKKTSIKGGRQTDMFEYTISGVKYTISLVVPQLQNFIINDITQLLYVTVEGEMHKYQDLLDNSKSPIADNEADMLSNPNEYIGYRTKLDSSINTNGEYNNGDYAYHLAYYIKHGLSSNTTLRTAYEKRNHIEFKDNYNKLNSNSERMTTALEEPTSSKDRELKIYKVIPKEDYSSEKYKALTLKDRIFISSIKELMQDTVSDVFPNRILSDDLIPYIFLNSTSSLKNVFLKTIGYQSIQEEHTIQDVLGNTKHIIKANSLQKPNIKGLVKVPIKKITETYYEYEEKVVTAANEQLVKLKKYNPAIVINEFKTYQEVLDFNDIVMKDFIEKSYSHINHDLPSVVHHFIEELYTIKTNIDFEHSYSLLLNTIAGSDFEARFVRANGTNVRDKFHNLFTGEVKYAGKHGKDTNLYKRVEAFEKPLMNVSRVNSVADQAVGVILRYVSMTTMMLNIQTNIKNVLQGGSSIMIEAAGGDIVNKKDIGSAYNDYIKNVTHIFSSMGKTSASSETAAILQYFSDLYEDHSEGKLKKEQGSKIAKITNASEAFLYSGMTGGEHFLQMGMALAMMNSHRVVPVMVNGVEQGVIMSRSEFINNRKSKAILPLLTAEQIKSLEEFTTKQGSYGTDNYKERDVVSYWVSKESKSFSKEQINNIIEAIKKEESTALSIFEGVIGADKKRIGGYKTVRDMVIYDKEDFIETTTIDLTTGIEVTTKTKNYNKGTIKFNDLLSPQEIASFTSRVRAMNHSLNGVYNMLDRSKIQNSLSAEVIMQFRKWMYPTWVRYMGSNFTFNPNRADKSKFNEALGKNESGIFIDLARFMRTPYTQALIKNKEAHLNHPELMAFVNMWKGFSDTLLHYKLNYNLLSNTEKANVRKGVQFIINTGIITITLFGAGLMYGGGDDEKDKFLKPKSYLVYNLAGLQTEHTDLIPFYGWIQFYKRTKQSAVPMERTLTDVGKLIWDTIGLTWRTPEEQIHKTGVYKGESKLHIDIEKAIPVYKQFHKNAYMTNSINYYNMNNWVYNVMN